jgi:hypothetical protein
MLSKDVWFCVYFVHKKSVPVVHGAFQFRSTFLYCVPTRMRNGLIASFQVFKEGEKQHSSNQYEERCSNIFKTRFVFVMYVYLIRVLLLLGYDTSRMVLVKAYQSGGESRNQGGSP